jgi:hypothetical protein
MPKTSNKIEIDKEKKQIVIPLPDSKLSVSQKLFIEECCKKADINTLTNYVSTFSAESRGSSAINQNIKARKRLHQGAHAVSDGLAIRPANSILDKFFAKCDVFSENLRPTPLSEKYPAGLAVGVEIECYLPISRDEVREALALNPIPNVRCGTDGSITPDSKSANYHCMEFRCLTNINNMQNLEKLCTFLYKHGARVNTSCGMHVHLDFRDKDELPETNANRLLAVLPLLKLMVPQSRLQNTYCEGDMNRGRRHTKINLDAFYKFKTIEMRLHSGTANYRKIASWIRIVHSIAFSNVSVSDIKSAMNKGAHSSNATNTQIDAISGLLGWVNEKTYLKEYMLERISKFNPLLVSVDSTIKKVAIDDDELDAEPCDIAKMREATKKAYRECYEKWHTWYAASKSEHRNLVRAQITSGHTLQSVDNDVLKSELERQLEIKENAISKKDFSSFYASFYMYDKRKNKSAVDRFPYLRLYFEKACPDIYKKVLACSPKREAERLDLEVALPTSRSITGQEMQGRNYGTGESATRSWYDEMINQTISIEPGAVNSYSYVRGDVSTPIRFQDVENAMRATLPPRYRACGCRVSNTRECVCGSGQCNACCMNEARAQDETIVTDEF